MDALSDAMEANSNELNRNAGGSRIFFMGVLREGSWVVEWGILVRKEYKTPGTPFGMPGASGLRFTMTFQQGQTRRRQPGQAHHDDGGGLGDDGEVVEIGLMIATILT